MVSILCKKMVIIKKCKSGKCCTERILQKSLKKSKKDEKKCLKLKILWDTLIEWSAGHGD